MTKPCFILTLITVIPSSTTVSWRSNARYVVSLISGPRGGDIVGDGVLRSYGQTIEIETAAERRVEFFFVGTHRCC